MKIFNTEQTLAFIKKECRTMNGLYEYMDMALNDLTVRQVCEKYHITRTELQWGKHYLSKLRDMLMTNNIGISTESSRIECGDAVQPFYCTDTTVYDTGMPITEADIRDNYPDDWPVSVDIVISILTTVATPLTLCNLYHIPYNTAWSLYRNIHDWAKYDLTGTYVNHYNKKSSCLDEVQLLTWAMDIGFPMDVISAFKDVFNQGGYVHPYQIAQLEEIREVMYKENIVYRSSTNKGKIHWGDKWKPFYIELPKGKII